MARYPDAPEALEARYLVGQCHLAKATRLRAELAHDVIPATRTARSELIQQQLDLALTWFERGRQALLDRQQDADLLTLEQLTLRDCEFAIGRVLFDLGRYEEAVETYLALANRYRESAPALDAYVQLSQAYGRLGRTEDARRALEKAKAALTRISDDDQFAATTIRSKAQWAELIEELMQEES